MLSGPNELPERFDRLIKCRLDVPQQCLTANNFAGSTELFELLTKLGQRLGTDVLAA